MPHDPFQNGTPAPQTPTYLGQQTPTWQSQVSSPQQPVQPFWAGLHQPVHQNGFQTAGVWHRQSVQQPIAPQPPLAADSDFELRPVRDRLQSAPELPVLGLQHVAEATTHTQGAAATHTRVHSQPSIPTPQSSNSQHRGSSGASSPQAESVACDTPSTPSQEGDMVETGWTKQESFSLSNEEPGPDLDDIDQLAFGVVNDGKGQDPFVFDEFVAWDDFPTVV